MSDLLKSISILVLGAYVLSGCSGHHLYESLNMVGKQKCQHIINVSERQECEAYYNNRNYNQYRYDYEKKKNNQ